MDQEMASFVEWAKVLLGFVGPIMVVWVTAKMSQAQKAQEMKHQDEVDQRNEKDKEMKEMIENLQKKVDAIDTDLSSVKKSVEEMERMDNKVHTDLATRKSSQQKTPTGFGSRFSQFDRSSASGGDSTRVPSRKSLPKLFCLLNVGL